MPKRYYVTLSPDSTDRFYTAYSGNSEENAFKHLFLVRAVLISARATANVTMFDYSKGKRIVQSWDVKDGEAFLAATHQNA